MNNFIVSVADEKCKKASNKVLVKTTRKPQLCWKETNLPISRFLPQSVPLMSSMLCFFSVVS